MTENLNEDDFTWDGYAWTTEVKLSSWCGFQSRRGDYASRDSAAPSDGAVEVIFAPEGRNNSPLEKAEVDLVNWAIRNDSATLQSLLESLLSRYPAIRRASFECDTEPSLVPEVADVEGFRKLIGLSSLYVHPIHKDGIPYVGYGFGCTWDVEHGLGVLVHGTRVVEVGGADTAFLLWIAEEDAGFEYQQ